MAGASARDIKNRIKSIESTMQITKAMELVSASKLRRAKERAQAVLPFMKLLDNTMQGIVSNCGSGVMSDFTLPREVKRTCIVLIAGDRGLAGGFNTNVFKQAMTLTEGKGEFCFLPIGKKAAEFCSHRKLDIISEEELKAGDTDPEKCAALCEYLTREYTRRKIDCIYVVYNEFVSMLMQRPQTLKLLPLNVKNAGEEKAGALTLYEPSPEAVIEAIVPQYIGGMLYCAVCESLAGEHGARRMAMDSATKNAGEMIDTLSLKYNRARQAAITQEITEIVSGADAL